MTEPPPPFDYRGTSFQGGYTTGQLFIVATILVWVILAILLVGSMP